MKKIIIVIVVLLLAVSCNQVRDFPDSTANVVADSKPIIVGSYKGINIIEIEIDVNEYSKDRIYILDSPEPQILTANEPSGKYRKDLGILGLELPAVTTSKTDKLEEYKELRKYLDKLNNLGTETFSKILDLEKELGITE